MDSLERVKEAVESSQSQGSTTNIVETCPTCNEPIPPYGEFCLDCLKVERAFGRRYLYARPSDIKHEKLIGSIKRILESGTGGLFIYGSVGTGKTHILAAIARRASIYKAIAVPNLMLVLRESFKSEHSTESVIIEKYARANLLLLDDLGAEKSTEYAIQSLYLIIDRRWREDKPTIITSNLNLTELAGKLDDRIASRIAGMCEVVKLTGKDRRL